ncbi:MAG: class I SAM-dependent methyltransferase [Acidimicrobiia bacterium]
MSARTRRKLAKAADNVGFWWHSIDLGEGVVTPGRKSAELLAAEWDALDLPDLRGKAVLDVGAWDGYFSFEAERRGAARVVALDHYVWSMDLPRQQRYWAECMEAGTAPEPYHELPELWKPDELPGKAGFNTAHRCRDSKVEAVVGDFMTMDLDRLGTFDVVLFLGVLYHVRHPLLALERLARITRQLLVIETEAVAVPGFEHHGFCEFFESNELNGDVSNWWAPNRRAVVGMCRAAGFGHVESREDPSSRPRSREALHRYRLVVRAWKGGPAAAGAAAPVSPPLPG